MTESAEPVDVALVAAALRADAVDVSTFAEVLTNALSDALPQGMVEVERNRSMGDRLAGRDGTPIALRVITADNELGLRRLRHGVEAEIRRTVRGVVISRRVVPIDEWVGALAAALTRRAEQDANARAALGRLLGA